MKIYSNFRDYYDCIQGYGIDPKIVYERHTQIIKHEPPIHQHLASYCYGYDVVGFCGNLYPLVRLCNYSKDATHSYCYSIEDVDKFAKHNFSEKELAVYYGEKDKRYYINRGLRRSALKYWFDNRQITKYDKCIDSMLLPLFERYNTPIFWWTSTKLTINPNLKEIMFFKVKDAFTAHQELAQYVGNVMVQPTIKAPQMSDRDLAAIKGFDKYSFRKEKQRER